MNIIRNYFTGALVFSVLAMGAGFMLDGLAGAWVVLVLGVLETSLSFDNAVVNASVLNGWGALWRRRFMVWGIPIAVFGMRLVFPLLIVSLIGGTNPFSALQLALHQPAEYARLLTSAHHQIAAYGGAFLMMVFLRFFLDENKDEHWLRWIEAPLSRLGRIHSLQAAVVLCMLLGMTYLLSEGIRFGFLMAGIWGLITYIATDVLRAMMGEQEGGVGGRVVKEGVAGFLYLEILDASFSFDGVIGAFALSSNIFVITLGLGIGAMFVRSITLLLVDKGSMEQFRYLEHGAFWAIGALACIMFVGVKIDIPEVITGFVGAAAIGIAFWSSVRANRRDARRGIR